MKAIFIDSRKLGEVDLFDFYREEEFENLLNEFTIMESDIVYFSAGESKIKEILIQKKPNFSV